MTPLATDTSSDRRPVAPATAQSKRVFVIDDDDVMLLTCRRTLEKDGYDVETFGNGLDGIRRIEELQPQLLLVDLKMPELDGLQVIERVRNIGPDVVIAVITGYATISTAVEAMKAGAYDFLPKPFTPDELRLIVNRGHERWRLAAESARLRREKDDAERRFVTFVSHQLKTPVVAAKQYLDVLLFTSTDELTPRTQEWLKRAQARLDEMLTLIRDWLELARIERGTDSLGEPLATSDLHTVIGDVIDASQSQAQSAVVTLETDLGPGIGPVRGDVVSLATILSNLVSNGIKYNRVGGRVTVRTTLEATMAVVEVSDTGIGIAEESLPRLFQEFCRVKNEQTRDIPGTGLGLAICKRLVTTLGGSIGVRSRLGEGTTFVVHIPTAANREGLDHSVR
jgi:two-component system sensor histidine kinase/response regulator